MNYLSLSSRFERVDGSAPRIRSLLCSSSVLCLLLLSGCEQESIHSYIAPKPKAPEMAAMTKPGRAVPTRMLGAILRQPDQTWFFKLTAPPDEAAALRVEFGTFVASTRFENGQPSWEIPDGWSEERGRAMRFTTYHIGQSGPEVSISTLPNNSDETEAALLNINRWRGQLGLSALQSEEFLKALESDLGVGQVLPEDEGEIVSISTPAGKAILIDFVGAMATGGGPPFANMGGRPAAPRGPAETGPPPAETSSATPQLSPPGHWKPGKLNSFRIAAFVVEDGQLSADVTLSTAGGDFVSNINRWRGQVDLPSWSADELAKEKQMLTGQGYTAAYVKLIGPTDAILGAVINHAGRQWFVKLTGPKELAEKEMKNFENFVKSIEF